jgi:hypothetical protein
MFVWGDEHANIARYIDILVGCKVSATHVMLKAESEPPPPPAPTAFHTSVLFTERDVCPREMDMAKISPVFI